MSIQYSHVLEVGSDVNGRYEMAAEWVMQSRSGCDCEGLVNRTDARLSSHGSSIPNRTGILSCVVFGILSLTQTCCSRCLCDKKVRVLFLNRWQNLFEKNIRLTIKFCVRMRCECCSNNNNRYFQTALEGSVILLPLVGWLMQKQSGWEKQWLTKAVLRFWDSDHIHTCWRI